MMFLWVDDFRIVCGLLVVSHSGTLDVINVHVGKSLGSLIRHFGCFLNFSGGFIFFHGGII